MSQRLAAHLEKGSWLQSPEVLNQEAPVDRSVSIEVARLQGFQETACRAITAQSGVSGPRFKLAPHFPAECLNPVVSGCFLER